MATKITTFNEDKINIRLVIIFDLLCKGSEKLIIFMIWTCYELMKKITIKWDKK